MAVLTVLKYVIGIPVLLWIFDVFLNALERSICSDDPEERWDKWNDN